MKTEVLNTRSHSVLALAAIAALGIGMTSVGHAAEPGDLPTASIRVDDLNLSTDAGAERLFGRLRLAAARVCADDPGVLYPLWESVAINACEQRAIAPPVQQLNAPLLTARYNRYYHDSKGVVVVEPAQG